jgi:hypothetical protein
VLVLNCAEFAYKFIGQKLHMYVKLLIHVLHILRYASGVVWMGYKALNASTLPLPHPGVRVCPWQLPNFLYVLWDWSLFFIFIYSISLNKGVNVYHRAEHVLGQVSVQNWWHCWLITTTCEKLQLLQIRYERLIDHSNTLQYCILHFKFSIIRVFFFLKKSWWTIVFQIHVFSFLLTISWRSWFE